MADPLSRRFGPGRGGGNDGKPALLNRFLGQASAPSTRCMATSSGASSLSSVPRSFRTSTTSSTTSRQSFRSRPPGGHGRHAMVTENDGEQEDEGEAGEEELVPAEEFPGQHLEEVLQAEAQLLAEDLQVLEDEGCEPELLEELEAGVESASEALVSMREARARINDVKKDRGYGKSGGGKPAADNKPHGNQVNSQKKNTRCFDCDMMGHWAGDKACTKPGVKLGRKDKKGKQVLISENVTEHALGQVGDVTSPTGSSPHDVTVVSAYGGQEMKTLSEALASTRGGDRPVASPIVSELAHDKKLVGALDSACNRTVTGFTLAAWFS